MASQLIPRKFSKMLIPTINWKSSPVIAVQNSKLHYILLKDGLSSDVTASHVYPSGETELRAYAYAYTLMYSPACCSLSAVEKRYWYEQKL